MAKKKKEHKKCVICGRDTVVKCSKCGKDVCLGHIFEHARHEPLLCADCYTAIHGKEASK